MKFIVFAALVDDINNGWIWIPENIVKARTVVKITNNENKKIIYCEALPIGKNFIRRYNNFKDTINITLPEESIVINEWYRNRIGIDKTQINIEIDIKETKSCFAKCYASLIHPQNVVRISIKLALFSAFLALLSLIIAIL